MRISMLLDHYLYDGYPDIKTEPYPCIFMHETRVAYVFPNERPQFLLFRLSQRLDLKTFRFSFYLDDQERFLNLNKNPPRMNMLRHRNSMYELYSRSWDREHGKVVVADYEDTDGIILDLEKIGGAALELDCFKKHLMFLTLVEITCYVIERNNRLIDNLHIEDKHKYYHEILAIFKDVCQDVPIFSPVRVRKSLSEIILMNDQIICPSHALNPAIKIGDIEELETFDVKESRTWRTELKLEGLRFDAKFPASLRVDFYGSTVVVRIRIHFGEQFGELKSYCGVTFRMFSIEDFSKLFVNTLQVFSNSFTLWLYDNFNVNGYKENLDTYEMLRRSIPYTLEIIPN